MSLAGNSLMGTVQETIRAITNTTGSYEGDWQAYATYKSISAGEVGARILALAILIDSTIGTAAAAHNYFLQNPTAITA